MRAYQRVAPSSSQGTFNLWQLKALNQIYVRGKHLTPTQQLPMQN